MKSTGDLLKGLKEGGQHLGGWLFTRRKRGRVGLEPVQKWLFLQARLAVFQAEIGVRGKIVD